MEKTRRTELIVGITILLLLSLIPFFMNHNYNSWLTDEVGNGGNKVGVGVLSVELWQKTDTLNAEQISEISQSSKYTERIEGYSNVGITEAPIFDYDNWEAGYSDLATLMIRNTGTLAAKYKLVMVVDNYDSSLDELLSVLEISVDGVANTISSIMNGNEAIIDTGIITPKTDTEDIDIQLKMSESAGGSVMGKSMSFSIQLRATQASHEADGSGNNGYDKDADGSPDYDWKKINTDKVTVSLNKDDEHTEVVNTHVDNATSILVPKEALAENAKSITLSVSVSEKPQSLIVDRTHKHWKSFNISVKGIKTENNEADIGVQINIGKNAKGIEVYNGIEKIPSTYYPETGNIRFLTKSFGVFTVLMGNVYRVQYDRNLSIEENGKKLIEKISALTDESTLVIESGEYDVTLEYNGQIGSGFIVTSEDVDIIGEGEVIIRAKTNGGAWKNGNITQMNTVMIERDKIRLKGLKIYPIEITNYGNNVAPKAIEVTSGATYFTLEHCEILPLTMSDTITTNGETLKEIFGGKHGGQISINTSKYSNSSTVKILNNTFNYSVLDFRTGARVQFNTFNSGSGVYHAAAIRFRKQTDGSGNNQDYSDVIMSDNTFNDFVSKDEIRLNTDPFKVIVSKTMTELSRKMADLLGEGVKITNDGNWLIVPEEEENYWYNAF